jgi:hypothetical protein
MSNTLFGKWKKNRTPIMDGRLRIAGFKKSQVGIGNRKSNMGL